MVKPFPHYPRATRCSGAAVPSRGEPDIVERAIGRTATFDRRTDEVGRTRVRVSRELLALAEREYLIVAELHRRRQVQLAA